MADNQITITEEGAFIPRSLFGHDVELTETLRQVGVLSTMNGQTADPFEVIHEYDPGEPGITLPVELMPRACLVEAHTAR
jgi:hypothetical protein